MASLFGTNERMAKQEIGQVGILMPKSLASPLNQITNGAGSLPELNLEQNGDLSEVNVKSTLQNSQQKRSSSIPQY